MNTIKNKYELEKDGSIVVDVQGWKPFIFNKGNSRCGSAYYGVSLSLVGEAGGVLDLDQVVRLRNFLNEHLEALAKPVENPNKD